MEVLTSNALPDIDLRVPERSDVASKDPIHVESDLWIEQFTLRVYHTIKAAKGEREPLMHVIAGEPFEMHFDEGGVVLRHPQWSLRGEGTTLLEAEQNLLDFARSIAPAYVYHPHYKLTKRAQSLKDFLLKVV